MLDQWRQKNLADERETEWENFLPVLAKYAKDLPIDAAILEVGSGPICISQMFPQKKVTYLDPLIDDFRRMFPGELPENECISGNAEHIGKPDRSYDLIICLDTIPFTINPELVLHEFERLLKPGARLILSLRVFSPLEARLHYWLGRYLPDLHPGMCPYYYSLRGIRSTLCRHFTITAESVVNAQLAFLPFFRREERMFVCQTLKPET
jgi:SAM-dependent methyltransferase